ncbi:MAG: MFS transporter, partial [Anaerolineae bacterium]|nr:MFS transporter [Anaerolineae bacterium]
GGLLSVSAFTAAPYPPLVWGGLDGHGRKRFLVLGVMLMLLANVLFAFARNTEMLFLASTVHGFALGTMLLAAYTITSDLAAGTGRGSSFGLTEESQYRGGLYGIILMVPILLATGYDVRGQLSITPDVWALTFGLYALGALVATVLSLSRIKDTRGALVIAQDDMPTPKFSWRLYSLLFIVFLTSASAYGIQPLLLKFISDHITANPAWIALAYAPAAIVLGSLPSRMGRLSDRYGRKLPMMVGLGASAIFSMLIPFMTSILPLVLFATVEAVCYSAAVPAEQALVADLTGGQKRGTGFGLYTLAQAMGKVLGYLGMGAIYDVFREGPFVINAVILLIGIILIWVAVRDDGYTKHG